MLSARPVLDTRQVVRKVAAKRLLLAQLRSTEGRPPRSRPKILHQSADRSAKWLTNFSGFNSWAMPAVSWPRSELLGLDQPTCARAIFEERTKLAVRRRPGFPRILCLLTAPHDVETGRERPDLVARGTGMRWPGRLSRGAGRRLGAGGGHDHQPPSHPPHQGARGRWPPAGSRSDTGWRARGQDLRHGAREDSQPSRGSRRGRKHFRPSGRPRSRGDCRAPPDRRATWGAGQVRAAQDEAQVGMAKPAASQ